MKEEDILHENGNHWVCRINGLCHVMTNGATHATSQRAAWEDLSVAIARCDYLANKD